MARKYTRWTSPPTKPAAPPHDMLIPNPVPKVPPKKLTLGTRKPKRITTKQVHSLNVKKRSKYNAKFPR